METTNLDSEYTIEDIKNYISDSSISQKSHKWAVVDKKRYIAHILKFKFNYTLDEIAEIFDYKSVSRHTSVRHLFESAENIFKDPKFLRHTEYVRKKFPFELPECKDVVQVKTIVFRPNLHEMTRLEAYQKRHGIRTVKAALKQIIQNL